jgi:hypothetical protein
MLLRATWRECDVTSKQEWEERWKKLYMMLDDDLIPPNAFTGECKTSVLDAMYTPTFPSM